MNNSKMMMIVMIVMMLLLIGVVVAGGYYMIGKLNANAEMQPAEAAATTTTSRSRFVELKQNEITTVDLKNPISVNLLDSPDGAEHVIRLSLGIGVDNTAKKESEEMITLLGESETVVRDLCNVVLRAKTKEDLSRNSEGISALKDEILEKLQMKFSSELIYEVYVGDIYWQ